MLKFHKDLLSRTKVNQVFIEATTTKAMSTTLPYQYTT